MENKTTDQPRDLRYVPLAVGHDLGRYDLRTGRLFAGDEVMSTPIDDMVALSRSTHWEDRVRAELLRDNYEIVLPDGFPCLFETPNSPKQSGHQHPKPKPWVVSPDIAMLEALLPDYQELWDSYTSQWGPDRRRVFAVGRLDGLSTSGIYRPGTTPEQVIGSTMLTHTDMYRRAPERLRAMHPMHATWTAGRP